LRLTDRIPDPIIVATTRRKRPVIIDNRTYQFVNLTAHKFFGYEAMQLLGETVQMAEREKAIADGFDHPELAGGAMESAKGLWFGRRELDWEKLVRYTLRLRNQVAARRLGYWMGMLDVGAGKLLSQLEDGGGHSYAPLEPSGPRKGPDYPLAHHCQYPGAPTTRMAGALISQNTTSDGLLGGSASASDRLNKNTPCSAYSMA
jgi:predicted transcriptional regulator of viral defense system